MIKKCIVFFVLLFLSFFVFGNAFAYENTISGDTIIRGGLGVQGDLYADRNIIKFNPSGWSGVDPTITFMRNDSQIKEMGSLYILSKDYIHIGPSQNSSGAVLIQTPSEIAAKSSVLASGNLMAGTVTSSVLVDANNILVGGTISGEGGPLAVGNDLNVLGSDGITSYAISLAGSASGLITLQTASDAGTYTLTLPTSDGNPDQVLSTNGSGVLSWVNQSGDPLPTGTVNNSILRWNSDSANWVENANFLVSSAGVITSGTWGGNAIDHGTLSGLSDDDHSQYALLAGRAGSQSLYGGTASGDDLILESTSNGTKGYVNLQPNGGNVGIGTATPAAKLNIETTSSEGVSGLLITQKDLDKTALQLTNSVGAASTSNGSLLNLSANDVMAPYGVMKMSWENTTAATYSITGMMMDFANLTPSDDDGEYLYGTYFNNPAANNLSNAYPIAIFGENWDGGIYISTTGNSNAVDVASVNPNAKSYFMGNVGIGINNPAQKLEVKGGGIKIDPDTAEKPACDATTRGLTWFSKGGTGVTDAMEVCAKNSSDTYAWRSLWP